MSQTPENRRFLGILVLFWLAVPIALMAVEVAAEPVLAAPPQVAQHLKDNAAQRKTTDATAPGDTGSPNSQPLETLAEEKAALVALYNATGGANWTNRTNWLTNVPVGQWHGVITDAKGRVTDLDLPHNGLTGEIPAELGILPRLQWLNLSWNELTGEIPAELGSLTNLRDLFLWGNELTGEIPAELGNLPKLQWLNLSENELTGEIPRTIAKSGKEVYKDREVKYGRVWIWRRNLCSSVWSRCRTPGGPGESGIPFRLFCG